MFQYRNKTMFSVVAAHKELFGYPASWKGLRPPHFKSNPLILGNPPIAENSRIPPSPRLPHTHTHTHFQGKIFM